MPRPRWNSLTQAEADPVGFGTAGAGQADVQGSAEAIVQALEKIGNDEVHVRVPYTAIGAIPDSDVGLAKPAPIIGFNVRANATAAAEVIRLRYYSIIYDLIDDIKQAASGLLKNECVGISSAMRRSRRSSRSPASAMAAGAL